MENMERITIQKRDRHYKWKAIMYKKLFYSTAALCLGLILILLWALRGNLALMNQIMLK